MRLGRKKKFDFSEPETVKKVVDAQQTFRTKLGGGKNPSKKLAAAFAEYGASTTLSTGNTLHNACRQLLGCCC
tara:strand:- start:2891 stop:3109 length:219 start_codon:yes stop_codon:yes gene_type:complete